MRRSSSRSGPTTRYATGHTTGGPNNRRDTRTLASGNSPASMWRSSSAMTLVRAATPWVTAMILAKAGSGGSGLADMKKRGAPAPT